MNNLRELLNPLMDNLTPSPPVFSVTISDDANGISVNKLKNNEYTTEAANATNELEGLVFRNYHEIFNSQLGVFEVDRDGIVERVSREITTRMTVFLERNMDNIKPNQTQLYKWLRYFDIKGDDGFGIVLLYNYLYSKAGFNMTFTDGDVHARNGILILEKIKENDEKSKS